MFSSQKQQRLPIVMQQRNSDALRITFTDLDMRKENCIFQDQRKSEEIATSNCFSSTELVYYSCMWGNLSQVLLVPLPPSHTTLTASYPPLFNMLTSCSYHTQTKGERLIRLYTIFLLLQCFGICLIQWGNNLQIIRGNILQLILQIILFHIKNAIIIK